MESFISGCRSRPENRPCLKSLLFNTTRNTCTQQPLARFTGFYLLKYQRERFENANICIWFEKANTLQVYRHTQLVPVLNIDDIHSHWEQSHVPFGAAFSPTNAKWNHLILQSFSSQTSINPNSGWLHKQYCSGFTRKKNKNKLSFFFYITFQWQYMPYKHYRLIVYLYSRGKTTHKLD